ncbi:MAG: GPW/gp25 family protein [Bacteroidota bacterium]|jgi:phage baseplate assembly protein W|nr:GPW/gp25 family protein [Bacteroidota bacterium]MEE3020192.1 GPW/gp25 family protein [Bacteroidota bacterium]|tara:strand:- start:140 stop:520 length:381 start_codon:yes stop_codon:yes gene_type:complete
MARYVDLDLDFEKNPFTLDVNTKVDVDAVKRSIRNLIVPGRFERLFQPDLSAGVSGLLFEHLTPGSKHTIEKLISQTIENSEPRASLKNVIVVDDFDNNGLKVTIDFTVLNVSQPATLEFTLRRLR